MQLSITFLERFPILLALQLWGPVLSNKCVIFWSDNEAVETIIDRQTSRCRAIMQLVRTLIIRCLEFNIHFKASHMLVSITVLPMLSLASRCPDCGSKHPWQTPIILPCLQTFGTTSARNSWSLGRFRCPPYTLTVSACLAIFPMVYFTPWSSW